MTDARLVLRRIPSVLGGGAIRLDVKAARRAILETLARPLDLALEAAAGGIPDIANRHMVLRGQRATVDRVDNLVIQQSGGTRGKQ